MGGVRKRGPLWPESKYVFNWWLKPTDFRLYLGFLCYLALPVLCVL